jgi:hypothetical protein
MKLAGRTLLIIVASVLGVGLTAWGLWAAYVITVSFVITFVLRIKGPLHTAQLCVA